MTRWVLVLFLTGVCLVTGCGDGTSSADPPPVRTQKNGDFKTINEQVWGKSKGELHAILGKPYGKRREKNGMEYWFYDLVIEDDEPESLGVLKALHFIWNTDGSWRGIGFTPPDKWHENMMNEARFPPDLIPK